MNWLGNAGAYERNRRECQEQAERASDAAERADWERRAARWARYRDEEQHREEDRRQRGRAFRRR